MAAGWAVASIGLQLWSMREGARGQRKAGKAAAKAGAATAENILLQSEETRRRMIEAQRGTLSTAIARAAASGVKVDVAALKEIEYGKGEGKEPVYEEFLDAASEAVPGTDIIIRPSKGDIKKFVDKPFAEARGGYLEEEVSLQAGGPAETSLEAYIHRAKETFARDIAWEERFAESQAKAARLGGQVLARTAEAQARVTEIQGWSAALSTGYSIWGPKKQ